MNDLAKYQGIIQLPGQSTSLLANSTGYHLLTYADSEYQCLFMHNLYYTFWISFIFERGRFHRDDMDRLIDMTIDFCRFMQYGVSLVNYSSNEFLSLCTDEPIPKLLMVIFQRFTEYIEVLDNNFPEFFT